MSERRPQRRGLSRRAFLQGAGQASLGAAALALVGAPEGVRAQEAPATGDAAALAERRILLRRGWNGVAYTGLPGDVAGIVGAGSLIKTVVAPGGEIYRNPEFYPTFPSAFNPNFPVGPGDALNIAAAWDMAWPQPLIAQPGAAQLGDQGGTVAWLGPDATPVAEALQGLRSSVGRIHSVVVWVYDRRGQQWLVHRSEGPPFLNSLAELHYGDSVTLRIELEVQGPLPAFPITWTQPPPGTPVALTREDADLLVVSAVVQNARAETPPGDPFGRAVVVTDVPQGTVVVAHSQPLQAGDAVVPAEGEGGVTASGRSYFYWVDDAAGALFEHPSRFVLVSEATGSVTVAEEQWWPVQDDQPLFTEAAVYWNPANWLYPAGEGAVAPGVGVTGLAAGVGPVRSSQAASRPGAPVDGAEGECALVINGARPSEWWSGDIGLSAAQMGLFLLSHGFARVETLGDPWGEGNALDQIRDRIDDLLQDSRCRSLTIYLVGHGQRPNATAGGVKVNGLALSPTELGSVDIELGLIHRDQTLGNRDVSVNLVVDACFAGRFEDVRSHPNVRVIVTSTGATSFAYSDLDGLAIFPLYPLIQNEPNPDDEGMEYSSGFIEDLNELMASARARSEIREWARQFNLTFMEILLYFAYESGRRKDQAVLNHLTDPGRLIRNGRSDLIDPATAMAIAYPDTSPLAPSVDAVSPAVGKAAGGDTVVLTGEALWGATTVRFGGSSATIVRVDSDTQITVRTPALALGVYIVEVVTPEGEGGSGTTIYRVSDQPEVGAVTPSSGPLAGGTLVTITGANLEDPTEVRIGGTAVAFNVNADGSLSATTPPGEAAGPVDVVVVTPQGTATSEGGFTYESTPQMHIAAIDTGGVHRPGVSSDAVFCVRVVGESGNAVEGATVSGRISGAAVSAVTDANGRATLQRTVFVFGTYTLQVTAVSHADFTHDTSADAATSASVTLDAGQANVFGCATV